MALKSSHWKPSYISNLSNHVLIVLLVCLLVFAFVSGCNDKKSPPREFFETCNRLQNSIASINGQHSYTGEAVPLKPEELGKWLVKKDMDNTEEVLKLIKSLKNIDDKSGSIVDAWGNPLIVVAYNGTFAGLGSKGKNGIWEQGFGDDIFCNLKRDLVYNLEKCRSGNMNPKDVN
jgi:hypothetical protein